MRHMILVLLYSSGVSVCVGSLESLVNCEFNQTMCKWTDYGFNDENYVPISMSVCGRNGNIRDCGNYDSRNWANSWRMENITNYTFYNIPPDVDVYGKMMIFADNFDKGQIYADHFTFSLMYSPGISADPTQARCLKYRYLLTANASLVVSYQTDLSVFEHDIPLTGHSGSQAFNLTDGYTQLPFVNKFRMHVQRTFSSVIALSAYTLNKCVMDKSIALMVVTKHFVMNTLPFIVETCYFLETPPLSLHGQKKIPRIVIKHSAFLRIKINPNWLSTSSKILQSFHFYNSTVSDVEYDMQTLKIHLHVAVSSTSHMSKAIFTFKPEICDISGNRLMDFSKTDLHCRDLVNASHNEFTDMIDTSTRILDVSHNKLTRYSRPFKFLNALYLNNNQLLSTRNSLNYREREGDSLQILDLSYNNISIINAGDLIAIKLIYLNLSRNQIRMVHPDAFLQSNNLFSLDLSHNNIIQIYNGTFSPLGKLEELYLQGNTFQVTINLLKGLFSLRILQVSFYTICCAKTNSIYKVECLAPVNEISSCENMIANPVLSAFVWYIALLAVFGNMIVFLYFVSYPKSDEIGVHDIFGTNLTCADFLMGVYLYIIAITNLHYTGQYGLNDFVWKHSAACTLSGITATLSREVSVFICLLITLEKLVAVNYPSSHLKPSIKRVSMLLLVAWVVSLFLALIPLNPDPNLENFYAQSGICVSFPLSVTRKTGWQYSMIVYVGINFLLFLGILIGQIAILVKVFSNRKNVQSDKTLPREASLAKTMSAIVLTDGFCWLSIGTIGLLTFLGIEVQSDVYAWVILVVLPINSAINPILYLWTAFKTEMQRFLLLLHSCVFLIVDTMESPVNCAFKEDLCNWSARRKSDVHIRKWIKLCGFRGRINNCINTDRIYPANPWKVGVISNNSLYNLPPDWNLTGRKFAYSDNTNYNEPLTSYIDHNISTRLLYSPKIRATSWPRCLKFKFIVTGRSHFLVSYSKDLRNVYADIPLRTFTPPTPMASLGYGFLQLPFAREFRLYFRAIFENEAPGLVLLSDIQLRDGLCPDTCPKNLFQCSSYECLDTDKVCDGRTDCSFGDDEYMCYYNSSGVNRSNKPIHKTNAVISQEETDGDIQNKSLQDEGPVKHCGNVSDDNTCCLVSTLLNGKCLQQNQKKSLQNSSLADICSRCNNSWRVDCIACIPENAVNNTVCFLPQSLNHETSLVNLTSLLQSRPNDHNNSQSSYSKLENICSEVAVKKCALFHGTQSPLICNISDISSGLCINVSILCPQYTSTGVIIYEQCVLIGNTSAKNVSICCIKKEETDFQILDSKTICGECNDRNDNADIVSFLNKTSFDGITCLNSSEIIHSSDMDHSETDISSDTDQISLHRSGACYSFCPLGCNCLGESFLCERLGSVGYTDRILLHNVECKTLKIDDVHNSLSLKSRQIFKLEIHDSRITNLEILAYYPYFIHRILINNSIFDKIHIESFVVKAFQSFLTVDLYSTRLSFFKFKDFSHFVLNSSDKSSIQFTRMIIHSIPMTLDMSGNAFGHLKFDYNFSNYFLFSDMVNLSHNALTEVRPLWTWVLDLSHNQLTFYSHFTIRLEVLYLNNNHIRSARRLENYDPNGDDHLRILDLSYNNITAINSGDLLSSNLIFLNLSRNHIEIIEAGAFRRTIHIATLDLSYNKISQIFDGTFLPLKDLEELYLHGNYFQVFEGMFTGLFNLRILRVSFYTICCAITNSKYAVQCIAPLNEISSCDHLIAVPVLNVAVWYIALVAAFGNLNVLLLNIGHIRSSKAGTYYLLTISLSCADFLMGLYLYIIAVTNLHYSGQYGLNDYNWRHSSTCKFSGVIATLSSEVSAFIVLLITLDRFLAIKYPFSGFKFTKRSAAIVVVTVWSVSLLLALIPLLPVADLDNFYAQSGICISLPLSVFRKSGWEYSMIVFVGINFILFLGILVGQILIFVEVVRSGKSVQSTKTREREASLATTLFAIVLTDVFCWIPIGTIGMLTFLGIEVQADVYAWIVVVVLPINSALNPILYTVTAVIRNKRRQEEESIAKLKKQLFLLKAKADNMGHRAVSRLPDVTSISHDIDNGPASLETAIKSPDE
ncbi:uncharacterized protein LOC134239664 [Saccostrea cucullata]|uniref:uncharacterized protein LOC134239664 n=1 Tax=Saccostrea cuccullata TaxID=36930 RepID=UPI002ED3DED8